MRGWGWIMLAVLSGCTGLNPAFEESSATDSSSRGQSSSASTTADPETSSTGRTGGVMDGTTTSLTGSSGPVSAGDTSASTASDGPSSTSSTGGEVEDGATGSDPSDGPVLLVYTVEGWMEAENTADRLSADNYCSLAAPDAATACQGQRRAILRTDGLGLQDLIMAASAQWGSLPVFGLYSGGLNRLAPTPLEMLGTLEHSLSVGGVSEPPASGLFFTGTGTNCADWTDSEGEAGLGVFELPNNWFSAGTGACSPSMPILCACRSSEDPF